MPCVHGKIAITCMMVGLLMLCFAWFGIVTRGVPVGIALRGGLLVQCSDLTHTLQQRIAPYHPMVQIADVGYSVQLLGAPQTLLQGWPNVSVTWIGPTVGHLFFHRMLLAGVVAVISVALYVTWRCGWCYAVAAMLSWCYDAIILLGYLAWTHLPMDLMVVSGLLTVLGYSLNDTMIIFNRVRGLATSYTHPTIWWIRAIQQTLSRTLTTSGLTLWMMLCVLCLGSQTLAPFVKVVSFGILIGTFSSIAVASRLAIWLGLKKH
jgi:preprotein translocase SecF subunit